VWFVERSDDIPLARADSPNLDLPDLETERSRVFGAPGGGGKVIGCGFIGVMPVRSILAAGETKLMALAGAA
jgi:hypothetical protein